MSSKAKWTYQFFWRDKVVATLWLDSFSYDESKNAYTGIRGNTIWAINREAVTHIRRLEGQR